MKKGFTLIELLIVVAIIAILAAIAIPNFLAAQVRAKVSRAKSELRTLNAGCESYFVDENCYPIWNAGNWGNLNLARLSTPIAYVSSIPRDPFKYKGGSWAGGTSFGGEGWYITYSDGNLTSGKLPQNCLIWSNGPDTYHSIWYYLPRKVLENEEEIRPIYNPPTAWGFIGGSYNYDPSNGTVSTGDIWVHCP